MDAEYVVVDVETTGYYPGGHDRIVEIGMVGLDPEGSVVDEYETLINSALADARATAALFASCLASLAQADLKRIIRSRRRVLRASAGDWPINVPAASPVPRVAADPDSMSGKAGKARRYGVSIIAESVFWNMMGVDTGT